MEISDVKLHRFLSLPNDILLCKSDVVNTGNGLSVKSRDSGRIVVRNYSFKFHMRSNNSSGTDSKLPERLRFTICASDIDSECIKGGYKVTCQTNSIDDTMRRDMPVLRDSRNRRRALADIFQDTNKIDFDNIVSMYENRSNNEKMGDMQADDILQNRRLALHDIFQDVSEDDLENLLSTDIDESLEVINSDRRMAMADIFADISEENLRTIIRNCELERSRAESVTEMEIPRRCRRCAKGNIFDDVSREDVQKVLCVSDNVGGESDDGNAPYCRRFGLADIFHDVKEDDIWRILSMFEEGLDDENEAEKRTVDRRRLALADIFSGVNEADVVSFLSDYCNEGEENDNIDLEQNDNIDIEQNDNFDVYATRNRREALGDIFCDVDNSEWQSFMTRYGTEIEQMIQGIEDEGLC